MARDVCHKERIEVEPESENAEGFAKVSFGPTTIVAEAAYVNDNGSLVLHKGSQRVAKIEVEGTPLEVPALVRRAVKYGGTGAWNNYELSDSNPEK